MTTTTGKPLCRCSLPCHESHLLVCIVSGGVS